MQSVFPRQAAEHRFKSGGKLNYWSAKDGTAEVDFIFQNDDLVIPIEVKAEINHHAKSFKLYRNTYNPEIAFRFSLTNFVDHGILKDVPLYDLPVIKKWMR